MEIKEKSSYFIVPKRFPCSINYIKAKIFLEALNSNGTLAILDDEKEPTSIILNVTGNKFL
jgi:hypothetical protein